MVVGSLVEVPGMLALVWGAARLRPRLFGGNSVEPTTQPGAPMLQAE
jgi:hypothetical protein